MQNIHILNSPILKIVGKTQCLNVLEGSRCMHIEKQNSSLACFERDQHNWLRRAYH